MTDEALRRPSATNGAGPVAGSRKERAMLKIPTAEITKQLEQRYAEAPVSLGLSSAGRLVQVFSTEDGATWTLVLTRPDGLSCIVATGKYWQTATPKKLGPEA